MLKDLLLVGLFVGAFAFVEQTPQEVAFHVCAWLQFLTEIIR